MKRFIQLVLVAGALAFSSCASFQWSPSDVRPVAGIATVVYLEKVPVNKRPKAFAELRAAAAKIQMVALSDEPTPVALAMALNEVSSDPAFSALATSLVRAYKPKADYLSTPEAQALLVNLSEGILDTVSIYESKQPAK